MPERTAPAPGVDAPVMPVAQFCLFLVTGATLATGQLYGLIPLVPAITTSLGHGAALGVAAFAAGYAIGMVLLGSLAGRLGARRVLVLSLASGGVVSILCAVAPVTGVFLPLRLLEGILLGGFPPAAFVATTQRVPMQKRLLANSSMVFGLLGSAGVVGLASTLLGTTIGWRPTLVLYGLALVAVAGVATRLGGLADGNPALGLPYPLFRYEVASPQGAFSAVCAAVLMASFVTVNAAARDGDHPTLALVIVLVCVLALLASARVLAGRPAEARRAVGLALALAGTGTVALGGEPLVAVALVTCGATLMVPASIQLVVMEARRSVPVAVATFTCSLFVGGSAAGLLGPVLGGASGGLALVLTTLLLVLTAVAAVRGQRSARPAVATR
ncbi:MFS transporter [Cellulomonas sp. URHB0016]